MTPTVITDQERHRRVVEERSRRKRDLAGFERFRREQAQQKVAALVANRRTVAPVWFELVVRLAESVPPSTFHLWLGPLFPLGAKGQTLYLAAPDGIRAWTERRYAGLIRVALVGMDCGYSDVAFIGEGETCL